MRYSVNWESSQEGRFVYEARTPAGTFAGVLIEKPGGWIRLGFNSDATRVSSRKFADMGAALEYMHAHREKRGLNKDWMSQPRRAAA